VTRPTFLVIGAHKSGTTSLYRHLRIHPEVFMPEEKEVRFFSDDNWSRGVEWYETLFSSEEAQQAIARGEASPQYSCWPLYDHVPERVAAVVPDARLVYIVRHPVERLIAHYRYEAYGRSDQPPIEEALLDRREFLTRSMYALQIDKYLEQGFLLDQFLLLTMEELNTSPAPTVRRLYEFLGVDPAFVPWTLGQVFNEGKQLRAEKPLTQRFRGSPLHRVARTLVPERLRHAMWRGFATTPIEPKVDRWEISDDTRRAVVAELVPDLERLRGYFGGDFQCWGLLEDALAR
jgi:hypothetical protein